MKQKREVKTNIKTASTRDAHIISRIHAESWKSAYKGMVPKKYLNQLRWDHWVTSCEDWIANRLYKTNIIHEDGMPVGCITYGKARDETRDGWGEVIALYMLPDSMHKGYGRQLLGYALAELARYGYSGCYLWVLEKNASARSFYESMGMTWCGDTTQVEILDKSLTELRYTISLDSMKPELITNVPKETVSVAK